MHTHKTWIYFICLSFNWRKTSIITFYLLLSFLLRYFLYLKKANTQNILTSLIAAQHSNLLTCSIKIYLQQLLKMYTYLQTRMSVKNSINWYAKLLNDNINQHKQDKNLFFQYCIMDTKEDGNAKTMHNNTTKLRLE